MTGTFKHTEVAGQSAFEERLFFVLAITGNEAEDLVRTNFGRDIFTNLKNVTCNHGGTGTTEGLEDRSSGLGLWYTGLNCCCDALVPIRMPV